MRLIISLLTSLVIFIVVFYVFEKSLNKDNNLVYVSGSVPGYRNSYVTLEK